MTPWSQEIYTKTLHFARMAHISLKDPGADLPNLIHLTMVSHEVVAALAVEDGLDGDLAIQCALLHDLLEDTAVNYDKLKELFGEAVANGAQALTKNDELPEDENMADSLARIQQQPREVWMVKLADWIANLEPPPKHWTVEKMQSYQAEARQIYDALHEASPFLAARLQDKIENYGQYFYDDSEREEPIFGKRPQFLHDIGIELLNGARWQDLLSDPRWCEQPVYLHCEEDRLDGQIDIEGIYFSLAESHLAASFSPQQQNTFTWIIYTRTTTLGHLANNARTHTLLAHHIRKALADDPAAQPVTVGVTKRDTAYLSHDKARVVLFEGSVHFGFFDTEPFVTRTDPPLAGLFNEQGQIVIPAQFENIYSFHEELAAAELNGLYGVINRDGAWVIEPSFLWLGSFFDGLCTAQTDQGWGLINREGEWVIPPRYHNSIFFSDGLAKVTLHQGAIKHYGLIDQSGQEIIPVRYRQLASSGSEWNRWEPVLVCDDSGKWGAFTTSGDLKVPCIHDSEEALRKLLRKDSQADEEDAEEPDDTETESEATDSVVMAQGLKLLAAGAGILFLCVVANYFRKPLGHHFDAANMFQLLFAAVVCGIILLVRGLGLCLFKSEDAGVMMVILVIVVGIILMVFPYLQ